MPKRPESQYENFVSDNELIPVPSLLETVNTKIISLLTTNIKSSKLIGSSREIMEDALKCLNIGTKVLTRRSNAMWDILLQTEDVAKVLTGSILQLSQWSWLYGNKKDYSNATRYIFIYFEDHLGLFVAQFGEVANVSSIKGKAAIATGDVEIMVTVSIKNHGHP